MTQKYIHRVVTNSLETIITTIVYSLSALLRQALLMMRSNMLHACSIFYRMQLPLVVVFNKIDIASHEFAVEWMTDYDAFQDALAEEKDQSYMTSLIRSMSLGLDEFYETLETVGVSAYSGEGMDDLFTAIDKAAQTFEKEYKPILEKKKKDLLAKSKETKVKSMEKLQKDTK